MEPFSSISGVYNSVFESVNDLVNSGRRYGSASSSSLVLDSSRGELVEAPVKSGRKGVSTERTIEALKNHSEAEKRRRARINAHFDTLRSLIPGAKKVCASVTILVACIIVSVLYCNLVFVQFGNIFLRTSETLKIFYIRCLCYFRHENCLRFLVFQSIYLTKQ